MSCKDLYIMPPEFILHGLYSRKSDIWLLGVLFFNMITLKQPYEGNGFANIMNSIADADYESELKNLS